MRLDEFDDDINVRDQRGGNYGSGGGGRGLGLILGMLPLLLRGRGGLGTLIVIGLLAFFFFSSGGLQFSDSGSQGSIEGSQTAGTDTRSICTVDAMSQEACNTLSSLDDTWETLVQGYRQPTLVFYSRRGQSGCGAAQSAMGPFYCPADQGIYLDTQFFDELGQQYGAAGDFARRYVIAHEVGHHIQYLTGTAEQVRRQQRGASAARGNELQVMMELQADCYAGVWAARNRDRMEAGDIEEGMRAAEAIGDDTLQRQAQGYVVPESFTHGTSEQRMRWLRRGLETGDPNACDTFNARSL